MNAEEPEEFTPWVTGFEITFQHQCEGTDEFLLAHTDHEEGAPIALWLRNYAGSIEDLKVSCSVLAAFLYVAVGCTCARER